MIFANKQLRLGGIYGEICLGSNNQGESEDEGGNTDGKEKLTYEEEGNGEEKAPDGAGAGERSFLQVLGGTAK